VAAALERIIGEHEESGRGALPTLRELSRLCGCSHVTLLRALQPYRVGGRVCARRGSGFTLAGHPKVRCRTQARALDSPHKWRRAARTIADDIMRDEFAAGSYLPSPKELCRSHGVCHRTLRRSLDWLQAENLVVQDRRRYLVPLTQGSPHRTSIALISEGDSDGVVQFHPPAGHEEYYALERKCAQMGLALASVTCDLAGGRVFLRGARTSFSACLRSLDSSLGVLLRPGALSDAHVVELAQWCLQHSRPLGILNDVGALTLPRSVLNKRTVTVFDMGYLPQCGRSVGQYLLRNGHTRVAYLSNAHQRQWSMNRLSGLSEAICEAGGRTTACVLDVPSGLPTELRAEQVRIREAWRLFAGLDASRYGIDRQRFEQVASRLERHLNWTVTDALFQQLTEPLFDRALRDRTVTAWVCANDRVAYRALRYLEKKGIAVPKALSVVAFDDSPLALEDNLSSYNFNRTQVMSAALNHLVYRASGRHKAAWVAPDGFVVPRGSVARLPGSIPGRPLTARLRSLAAKQRSR
jgi:DNA-binding FadR family transcriptional regulator